MYLNDVNETDLEDLMKSSLTRSSTPKNGTRKKERLT